MMLSLMCVASPDIKRVQSNANVTEAEFGLFRCGQSEMFFFKLGNNLSQQITIRSVVVEMISFGLLSTMSLHQTTQLGARLWNLCSQVLIKR